MKIAVLMTVHNRKQTTVRCLQRLVINDKCKVISDGGLDVFVVDDGSTDGTSEEVEKIGGISPDRRESRSELNAGCGEWKIHLIPGTGNLYWAKGMRLAWETAVEQGDYDGYLWLNDDVELAADALERLATTLQLQLETPTIIVGECVNAKGEVTYGIKGDLFDGNFVYVPRSVYEKIGMICGDYAHAWADSDYALKAKRAGVNVVSCGVIGKCEWHELRPRLKGKSLKERVRLLKDPKGWNLHDLWLYRQRNWGVCAAVVSCVHLVLHVLIGER